MLGKHFRGNTDMGTYILLAPGEVRTAAGKEGSTEGEEGKGLPEEGTARTSKDRNKGRAGDVARQV